MKVETIFPLIYLLVGSRLCCIPKISFLRCLELPYKFVRVVRWWWGFHSIMWSYQLCMGWRWAVTIYNVGSVEFRLQKIVLPFSSSPNTVALVTAIICLGTSPSKARCMVLVIRLLPVLGVLPLPESVSVVEKPLWSGCRILYRNAARFVLRLAGKILIIMSHYLKFVNAYLLGSPQNPGLASCSCFG